MAYFNYKFKKARLDQSPYLFHFIKGKDDNPYGTLTKILFEEKLCSKLGVICFSASPLTAITKFFNVMMKGTDKPLYHPYGIGFSRDMLVRDYGARNLIYVNDDEYDHIPEELKWRTDRLNVDAYDFEYLREWRIRNEEFDFSGFPKEHMIIVAPTKKRLNELTVQQDVEFKPIVNYFTGDVEPDWDEVLTRAWKGIAVEDLDGEYLDDYAISGSTVNQVIGERMEEQLFEKIPWLVGTKLK